MLKGSVLSISFLLLSFHAIGGILPEIRDALEITQTQSEVLITIPAIASLIFVMLSNPLIDKFGMKKVVVSGLLLLAVGGIMPAFGPANFVYLLVARFVMGAGKGLAMLASIAYINLLFEESQRSGLIGLRTAVELVGQSVITLGVGALAIFGWRQAFWMYGIAFLPVILVMIGIPKQEREKEEKIKMKPKPIIFVVSLFMSMMVIASATTAVRFPAISAEIMGGEYNSSLWVAMKPLLGIVAGLSFGKLSKVLGKKLFYIGFGLLIVSTALLGFGGESFVVAVAGFLASSFVLGWVVPFMISFLSRISEGKEQRVAMSVILIFVNVSMFMIPFIGAGLDLLVGSGELGAPFKVFTPLLIVMFVSVMVLSENKRLRKRLGLVTEEVEKI